MSSELIERLEKRARTYSWDSTTFYTSDADLMLKSAATITQLQAELAEAREVPGRIVAWLNSRPETLHHDDIANAIEARDWSKP